MWDMKRPWGREDCPVWAALVRSFLFHSLFCFCVFMLYSCPAFLPSAPPRDQWVYLCICRWEVVDCTWCTLIYMCPYVMHAAVSSIIFHETPMQQTVTMRVTKKGDKTSQMTLIPVAEAELPTSSSAAFLFTSMLPSRNDPIITQTLLPPLQINLNRNDGWRQSEGREIKGRRDERLSMTGTFQEIAALRGRLFAFTVYEFGSCFSKPYEIKKYEGDQSVLEWDYKHKQGRSLDQTEQGHAIDHNINCIQKTGTD